MTPKQITKHIAGLELRLEILKRERNNMIFKKYEELFNIHTWNKLKASYVHHQLASEFELSLSMIKKVIISRKANKP